MPWQSGNEDTKARPKEQEAELIGEFINYDIQVTSTINSGSFGEIYLGVSQKSGQQYAIKVMKKSHAKKNTRYLIKEFTIMWKISGQGKFPKA